jgi:hypothetical protein
MIMAYPLPRINIQATNLKDQYPQFGRQLDDISDRFDEYLGAKEAESRGEAGMAASAAHFQELAANALIAFVVALEGQSKPDGSARERPVVWVELKEEIDNDNERYLALVDEVRSFLESFDFPNMNLSTIVDGLRPLAQALIVEFEPDRTFQRSTVNLRHTGSGGGGEEAPEV